MRRSRAIQPTDAPRTGRVHRGYRPDARRRPPVDRPREALDAARDGIAVADLRKHFPTKVTDSCIWKRIKIAEAPSAGCSIFKYAPNSESAADFEKLARELEARLGLFSRAAVKTA